MVKRGRAQVSIEYLLIVGFITFIIMGILGVAFIYSASINDRIKIIQMNNFANKIISSAESVSYAGDPSKTTITAYLPEGVESIEIHKTPENLLVISLQSSSGTSTTAYSSNVDISGSLTISSGLKKIEIKAESGITTINQI